MAFLILPFFLQVASAAPVVMTPAPTLADTPLYPILWSFIVFLAGLLVALCVVVINIVKSRFLAIEQNMEKFHGEIVTIKNDIRDLQHKQDIFNKDLQIKDEKIENVRLHNRLQKES